jgi:hypothetical protein
MDTGQDILVNLVEEIEKLKKYLSKNRCGKVSNLLAPGAATSGGRIVNQPLAGGGL